MVRVYACLTQQHNLPLVVLAAFLCLFASFAALSIVNRSMNSAGGVRLGWLAAGSLISAGGIWATHFVAMLAFDTGLPTGYDIKLTILSFVTAVVMTGLGLGLPIYHRSDRAPLAGGLIFGIGISAMHFVGMKGLLVPAEMAWDGAFVIAAWLIGCSLAMLAMRWVITDASMSGRIKGALTLTFAICGMHFTGMTALELTPSPLMPMPDAFVTPESLAIDIGLAALVILAISISSALVDQHLAGRKALEAERLHCLVNATFEGIGICADGRLMEANDALADLLKTPASRLAGQSFASFVDAGHQEAYERKLGSSKQSAIELPLLPETGPPLFAELLIRPIDYGGRSARVIAVRDITERRAARQRLEDHRDQLEQLVGERTAELQEQAARLKQALDEERKLAGLQRQFVSMVSHEFRTPLAIIDGNAQRLLRRSSATLPERAAHALGKIRTSVTRLTELMESVLAAARLEDGRIAFNPGACSLHALIEEVAGSYGELHADYQLSLDLDRMPREITADGKLLRQVFSNLISNAIKYSPDGSHVWIEGAADHEGAAVVTVRDQGVGIPEAEQQQLFRRFFRASTSAGFAGSGIGLHLAMHLARMHGGDISVESVAGEGSTFRVRLPIEENPAADAPKCSQAGDEPIETATAPNGLIPENTA